MSAYLKLTLTDTLNTPACADPSFGGLTWAERTVWCRLPAEWVSDGRLCPRRGRVLLEHVRSSRTDCGDSVVLRVQATVLSAGEVARRPWLADRAAFLVWDADAGPRAATAREL